MDYQPRQALPTTIRSPPSLDDYVPLAEHQSRTPESFIGGKPVLHFHTKEAKAYVPASQRHHLPFFRQDGPEVAPGSNSGAQDGAEELIEQTVDLYVTSETFTIFSANAECGLAIPYPIIGIQAIRTFDLPSRPGARSLYTQLNLNDGGDDDDTFDTVELSLVPPPSASSSSSPSLEPEEDATHPAQDAVARLFEAVANCQELHPDPVQDGDEEDDDDDRIVFESSVDPEAVEGFVGVYRGAGDGGLPPPLPGSSGWITAENMHEYFDEEGNWIGDEEEQEVSADLGEGAGRVRGRDEVDGDGNGEGEGATNGHRTDEESKRLRVE